MHRTSVRTFALALALVLVSPAGLQSPSATTSPAMTLDPAISFEGGSPVERATVLDTVESFTSAGLALPDLGVHIHLDNTGCGGSQGLFHHNNGDPYIDLCFHREFLALHELGHVWEHFNLGDQARNDFRVLAGVDTWNSPDVSHGARAIEIAADSLAHGLLSIPIECGQNRDREFARFEALTGVASPRLDLAATCDNPTPSNPVTAPRSSAA